MTKKRSNYQFYDHNVAAVPEASGPGSFDWSAAMGHSQLCATQSSRTSGQALKGSRCT